jgi:hypothetical protein
MFINSVLVPYIRGQVISFDILEEQKDIANSALHSYSDPDFRIVLYGSMDGNLPFSYGTYGLGRHSDNVREHTMNTIQSLVITCSLC